MPRVRFAHPAGFTLIELLVVVTIIGIVAALAVPALARARMSGNEASAVASLRAIVSAQATFAASCGGGGYAVSLADLGLPADAGHRFIPPDVVAAAVGSGQSKSGYQFAIESAMGSTVMPADQTCNGSENDPESEYFAVAEPVLFGSTGGRYFAADHDGRMRQDVEPLTAITDGTPLR